MMDNTEYGWERLTDLIEKEAEKEAKQQQQDDDGQYDMGQNIKLSCKDIFMKEFIFTVHLKGAKTKMIIAEWSNSVQISWQVQG